MDLLLDRSQHSSVLQIQDEESVDWDRLLNLDQSCVQCFMFFLNRNSMDIDNITFNIYQWDIIALLLMHFQTPETDKINLNLVIYAIK